MKPMIVGIGGAGGNILKQFLQSQDISLPLGSFGKHLAFGNAKGVWLESATQDVQDQNFYGDLENDEYPGYLVCHKIIRDDSPLRKLITDKYGFNLKAQGYDRRAEYLKGIFEVFDLEEIKKTSQREFGGEAYPLPGYMWKCGIRPSTVLGLGLESTSSKGAESVSERDEDAEGAVTLERLLSPLKSIRSTLKNSNGDSSKRDENKSKTLCDSILFIASLGGGTGTGFINPITDYIRQVEKQTAFPIFALGILTEKGMDARKTDEGQKNLGATIAMYDLLTKPAGEGIDSLIVVDNQKLIEENNGDIKSVDKDIYSSMRPLLDIRNYPGAKLQDDALAMKRVFTTVDQNDIYIGDDGVNFIPTPILVPCYHSHSGSRGGERSLVEDALQERSRLFPCVPDRADRAFVFTRGFVKEDKIKEAINELTDYKIAKVEVYRKLGNGGTEDILILLRNPYGEVAGEQEKERTLESRIYEIVKSATEYIDNQEMNIIGGKGYTPLTKESLRNYFYGPGGMRKELTRVKDRITGGERPIFLNLHPPCIFSKTSTSETADIVKDNSSAKAKDVENLVQSKINELLMSTKFDERVREIVKGS